MELQDWLIYWLPRYIAVSCGITFSIWALRRHRRAAVLSLVGWSILFVGLVASNLVELKYHRLFKIIDNYYKTTAQKSDYEIDEASLTEHIPKMGSVNELRHQLSKLLVLARIMTVLRQTFGWFFVLMGLFFACSESTPSEKGTRRGFTYKGLDLHAVSGSD